jgi:pimeloyl-ACP methyl ester carboxylesterase
MLPSATERRLSAGEVQLVVHEMGSPTGAPVVLLHGFPECAYAWRHQARALVDAGFRVIVPDQRGYARSDKPRGLIAYRIDRLAGDVVGLLDTLEIPRADVVGHDWGGTVGWTFAALHPGRVRRLVAMNGPHPAHAAREIRTNPAQLRRSSYMFLFQIPVLAERILLRRGFVARALHGSAAQRGRIEDEAIDVYTSALHQPGAATGMLSWYRAAMRLRPPTLPQVLARTLVIWGDRDPALGRRLAQPPERYVRDLQVRHVPDAGHWVQEEQPELVNSLLLEFLSR